MSVSALLSGISGYGWKARVRPVILTGLPLVLPVAAVLPGSSHNGRWWFLAQLGGLLLLAEPVGRARGKRLEPALFEAWGGKPTVQILRWRGPTSRIRLTYLHRRVQDLVGSALRLPSEAEERANPVGSDEIYDAAGAVLRARARALPGGELLAEHNVEYGFRRNALGLRPWGLVGVALGLAGLAGFVVWDLALGGAVDAARVILWSVLATVDCALLLFWARTVRPAWVEAAAWDYAQQLFETVGVLDGTAPATGTS